MQVVHIIGITGKHIADSVYGLFMLLDQFGESLFFCVHLHFVYLLDRQQPEKLYDKCDFFEKKSIAVRDQGRGRIYKNTENMINP